MTEELMSLQPAMLVFSISLLFIVAFIIMARAALMGDWPS